VLFRPYSTKIALLLFWGLNTLFKDDKEGREGKEGIGVHFPDFNLFFYLFFYFYYS